MRKIISQFHIGKYQALQFNKALPTERFTELIIEGKTFKAIPIYDADSNWIAIESSECFIDKIAVFK